MTRSIKNLDTVRPIQLNNVTLSIVEICGSDWLGYPLSSFT